MPAPEQRLCEHCREVKPTVMYDQSTKRWLCHRCWSRMTPGGDQPHRERMPFPPPRDL